MMADEGVTSEATAAAEPAGGGIKTAAAVIEKVLAADKADKGPGLVKVKGGGAPSKAEPGRRVEALEAKSVEKAEAEPAPVPDDAGAIERARYYLQQGDVAKALDVFGDLKSLGEGMPDAAREALARKLGVNSAQWEKFRKVEARERRALQARESELSSVIERLKTEYAPLHQARKLYESGDYDAAFTAAFGEGAEDYQRKIIGQRIGKDPEVEKLRAELEAERAERKQRDEKAEQTRAEAEQRQAIHDYLTGMQSELTQSDDLQIRKFAHRPQFIQRVYQIQKESYDQRANTILPLAHAAEMVRDEILNSLRAWSGVDETTGAPPANAARASALPVTPPVKAARNLKQSQAAEANGKPVKLTSEQVREYHQRLMERLPAD